MAPQIRSLSCSPHARVINNAQLGILASRVHVPAAIHHGAHTAHHSLTFYISQRMRYALAARGARREGSLTTTLLQT